MGGTWMIFIFGFAGFSNAGGKPTFNPNLPKQLEKIKLNLTLKDNLIEVEISQKTAKYTLKRGKGIEITQKNKEFKIDQNNPTKTLRI